MYNKLFTHKLIKKNITPNKKINGNISKIIDGIFKMHASSITVPESEIQY